MVGVTSDPTDGVPGTKACSGNALDGLFDMERIPLAMALGANESGKMKAEPKGVSRPGIPGSSS